MSAFKSKHPPYPHSEGVQRRIDMQAYFDKLKVPTEQRKWICLHRKLQDWPEDPNVAFFKCSENQGIYCDGHFGDFYGLKDSPYFADEHVPMGLPWACLPCTANSKLTINNAWRLICKNYLECRTVRDIETGEHSVEFWRCNGKCAKRIHGDPDNLTVKSDRNKTSRINMFQHDCPATNEGCIVSLDKPETWSECLLYPAESRKEKLAEIYKKCDWLCDCVPPKKFTRFEWGCNKCGLHDGDAKAQAEANDAEDELYVVQLRQP